MARTYGRNHSRHTVSRRGFLKGSALALTGVWLDARGILAQGSPNDKLNIGVIGVGNRGSDNLAGVASQNIVALCDVDENYLNAAAARFPRAVKCRDFRRLLDRNDVEAVVASTADHTHAVATLAALRSGRHVYCEKPLTHTVVEARRVTEATIASGRATQLGTQIHSLSNYRRVVELVQSGTIGPVREVHVFCDKCWGGGDRPAEAMPVPATLDWDLWLGPALERPYHETYHPANWRRFWDFGGGTLGDMACHYMDLPFWALGLKHPTSVETLGPEPSQETAPRWLVVHYEFPATGDRPAVALTWYDGQEGVDNFAAKKLTDWRNGVVFVGDGGTIVADYTNHTILPQELAASIVRPDPYIPESPGHHEEWIEACKGRGNALCRFEYSGPLTETVLLGIVAYRAGCRIEWEARSMKVRGWQDAEPYLHRAYRTGWEI
ncbi:MAG: Gfo/Idh/MocA family oxidoreductase [Planctomycetota bacterium]